MPKKPTRRKRPHGKRRARAQRTARRQPVTGTLTPPAPGTAAMPAGADRERLLAELEAITLVAMRHQELALTENDVDEELDGPYDFDPEAHRILLDAIDEVLVTGVAQAAYDIDRRLAEHERRTKFDLCPGDGPLVGEMVAVSILLELRYVARPHPTAAVRWVSDRLGAEHGRQALRVADLLGHPDAPPWSSIHPPQDGAEPLLPALMLLLAGVAATTLADHLP